MNKKIKKNPKYMDECFRDELQYELPKKKNKHEVIEADEDFDIGV